ncbi:MAG: MBL fold metallo-hydrolase [Bhargavaea sp.]
MKVIPVGIWGGYPKAESATSSFLIEHEGFRVLFDCGSGVLAQVQKYVSLDEIDAVVISHYHADHVADVGSLQYHHLIAYYTGRPLRKLTFYGHDRDADGFGKLTYKEVAEGHAVAPGETYEIGPFSVTFAETVHPVYCLAARFEADGKAAVFTADTEFHEPLAEFASGADLLVSESNLYEEYKGKSPGHMAGSEAGELARLAGAKRLLLTHLPQDGDVQLILSAAQEAFGGSARLAEAGDVIEV